MKHADHSQSRIQALFLDAVGPLTGLLDSINKDEIVVEDVEAEGRAAPTFLGNASSQCNTDRRLAILEEYNKDSVIWVGLGSVLVSNRHVAWPLGKLWST